MTDEETAVQAKVTWLVNAQQAEPNTCEGPGCVLAHDTHFSHLI